MTATPTGRAATSQHAASEQRAAARALLACPILTAARHPEELALVRRQAPALKAMFSTLVGYQLVVEASFARLQKGPLSPDTPVRAALRVNGEPFAPRTYTYLALVCAGLLSTPPREQVLISALVAQVRLDASLAGVARADTRTDDRHLVHAILYLIELGALTETSGTVALWQSRREEALLDVARPLLPHLLTRSLADVAGPEALLEAAGTELAGPEQPRRSLRRKLVENPLVRREDLSDAERDALSRDRHAIEQVLDEAFGLTLEVRLEGALTYDTSEVLTDVAFPGGGDVARVALLLINALADDLGGGAPATAAAGGIAVPGVLASWDMVDAAVELLIEQYGSSFGSTHTADPAALRTAVVALLESVAVARSTPDGLLLHPVAARYQPEPVRTPAPARSALEPVAAATLFDTANTSDTASAPEPAGATAPITFTHQETQ